MKFSSTSIVVAIIAGLMSAAIAYIAQAQTDDRPDPVTVLPPAVADAVFAGGCFWCVEKDFDQVDGVLETISGYTGGNVDNPTYKQVVTETTGHYEAVRVVYDPSVVTYDELVEYFWRTVDPTDPRGQFCDKGDSYRTAIFARTDQERETAENSKAVLEASGVLPDPVVTPVLDRSTFWPAEGYHQDYYKKNPLRYRLYRTSCGRDARVKELWGDGRSS